MLASMAELAYFVAFMLQIYYFFRYISMEKSKILLTFAEQINGYNGTQQSAI